MRWKQVGTRLRDTLTRRRSVLGEDDPETLATAGNLGVTLRDLGEARSLHEDALARQRRMLGPDHPSTLAAATNLATDLYDLGELDAVRELDEDTLARKRHVLGQDHPDTRRAAHNVMNIAVALTGPHDSLDCHTAGHDRLADDSCTIHDDRMTAHAAAPEASSDLPEPAAPIRSSPSASR